MQAYYTVDIPEGATAVQFGAGNSRNLTSADNGSEFRLTRPQLVEGDSPRTWEPVDMASEMVKCQRFYEKINFCFGTAYNSTLLWLSMPFKVEKAKTPTVSYGVGNTPNVVQALRPSGSQNLPLREGALTGDSKGIYFNGNLLDSGVAVTDVGTWFCYVEAEVPF